MKRRSLKKQKIFIISSSLILLLFLTVGYAAFQTSITMTAKGNIKKNSNAASQLSEKVVTTGDGLYADSTEEGRLVFKGANPDNNIKINDENWKIISVENDGSLKLVKEEGLGKMKFDSGDARNTAEVGGTYCTRGDTTMGCNAWNITDNYVNESVFNHTVVSGTVLKDAELNTYLNETYYNNLTNEIKDLIKQQTWFAGPVETSNSVNINLATQIQEEKSQTWTGKIGLVSSSDIIKANTNVEECGDLLKLNNSNGTCKTTNYMDNLATINGNFWLINATDSANTHVLYYNTMGSIASNRAASSNQAVLPVIYLKPNITLEGDGSEGTPYTITAQ